MSSKHGSSIGRQTASESGPPQKGHLRVVFVVAPCARIEYLLPPLPWPVQC